MRGSNGLIENNLIDWTQQASLALFPEYGSWYQSGWARNVRIRGNTFKHSWSFGNTPAVAITGGDLAPPAGLFRDIEISGNVFDSCVGVNLAVTSAIGVTISNNSFRNALLNGSVAVTLRNTDSVSLAQNCLSALGQAKPLIIVNGTHLRGEMDGIGLNCIVGAGPRAGIGEQPLPLSAFHERDAFSISLPAGEFRVALYGANGKSLGVLYTGYWQGGLLRQRSALPEGG